MLTPRNHGGFAWVFLANFGGGLVDGDRIAIEVDVGEGASALLATQGSTKVYRSARGCSQDLRARVADRGTLAILPDPVVCFAGAQYSQNIDIALAPGGSLVLLDGYTCGRSARGERWQFTRYASRTCITRGGLCAALDATRLDAEAGPIAERMGRFEVLFTLLAIGPRVAQLRESLLALATGPAADGQMAAAPVDALGIASGAGGHAADAPAIAAASPIGNEGAILRVAAERVQGAMHLLRPSLAALAELIGDDPFARKW